MGRLRVKPRAGDVSAKLIKNFGHWATILEINLATFGFGSSRFMTPAQRRQCREAMTRLHDASGAYLSMLDEADREDGD